MALAVVQGCVTQLIDVGRPLTAQVAASAQADTSSVSLTIALSPSADAMGDARDRSDDADQAPVYAQLLAEIQSPV